LEESDEPKTRELRYCMKFSCRMGVCTGLYRGGQACRGRGPSYL